MLHKKNLYCVVHQTPKGGSDFGSYTQKKNSNFCVLYQTGIVSLVVDLHLNQKNFVVTNYPMFPFCWLHFYYSYFGCKQTFLHRFLHHRMGYEPRKWPVGFSLFLLIHFSNCFQIQCFWKISFIFYETLFVRVMEVSRTLKVYNRRPCNLSAFHPHEQSYLISLYHKVIHNGWHSASKWNTVLLGLLR